MRYISKPIKRVDAEIKVKGRARYINDIKLPNMLYGAVVHPKYPHAKILSIDPKRALRLKGVVKIITHEDIPGEKNVGVVKKDLPVFAYDKVRYMGDGIALVVAETQEIARKAAKLIEVEYEVLQGVFDPEEAMKDNAPKVHDDGNLIVYHKVRKGDVKKGFEEADIVIERQYKTQFVEHSYLETEGVIAEVMEDGTVRIMGSIQNAFSTQKDIARVMKTDISKVQIIQTVIGGSFGGKDDIMTVMAARAAVAAKKTGRPVKIVNTREDSILESYKRHPYRMYYRLGLKKDGKICALEAKLIADGGAYASTTPFVTWRSNVQAAGPYRIENVKVDTYGVYTNNNFTGAMRGFGSPQVNFAIESLMDEAAHELGMDPLEFRLQNALRDGDTTATGQRLTHKVSLRETLLKATKAANWDKKRKKYKNQKKGRYLKGIGLASSLRGVSLGAEGADAAGIEIKVEVDGSVVVEMGLTDMGQGIKTVIAQIIADELGIPIERILILPYDTSRVPDSGPTVASRATTIGGGAAKEAVNGIIETLKTSLKEVLHVEKIEFKSGVFHTPKGKVTFDEAVKIASSQGKPLNSIGWFRAPSIHWDEEKGRGEPYFTYVYATQVAEVEVDTYTGKVKVLRVIAAHEVGKAINPSMAKGQIYGGVAMAMGYALLEEFEIRGGIPKTLNFDEYLIPTAPDMPEVIPILVENPDPLTLYGVKSLGEPTNEILAPAIANAIFNATGKRLRELPMNLEEVFLGKKLERS